MSCLKKMSQDCSCTSGGTCSCGPNCCCKPSSGNTLSKKVPCAYIADAFGDGRQDASAALAKAAAEGYVVQAKPGTIFRVTQPANFPPQTTLLNLNLVIDLPDGTGPWCDLSQAQHVYILGCEITSKSSIHTPIITGLRKTKIDDPPQAVFIDLIRWNNIVAQETDTDIRFVTYP